MNERAIEVSIDFFRMFGFHSMDGKNDSFDE